MNEIAQELNQEERDGLAKLLAMDVNAMSETHIAAIKARRMYLTPEEIVRFPFLNETPAEVEAPKRTKKSADAE